MTCSSRRRAYQQVKSPDTRGQTWTTGPVEVSSVQVMTKGTVLEPGVGGPGGGLVPPLYQPGVVSKLFEPLGVRDVFGSSQTTASQVRYVTRAPPLRALRVWLRAPQSPSPQSGCRSR